jgi:transcriptional regulator NrdR family protein
LACGGQTTASDGRLLANGIYRRRRICITCGERHSTYEVEVSKFKALLANSKRNATRSKKRQNRT